MNCSMPEKSTIASKYWLVCRRDNPRMDAFRNTFSRPVRSPWKPAPSSSSAASRPRRSTYPWFGVRIPPMTFNSVDLPEPLRPIRPRVCPDSSSKEMSRRAQNCSTCSRLRRKLTSRSLSDLSLWMLNCLETSATRTMGSEARLPGCTSPVVTASELLREIALGSSKHPLGEPQQHRAGCQQGKEPTGQIAAVIEGRSLAGLPQGALERQHDVGHGVGQIQLVGEPPAALDRKVLFDLRPVVDDGREPEPQQQPHLDEVLHVSQVDIGCGQHEAERRGEDDQHEQGERDERQLGERRPLPGDREGAEQDDELQPEVDDRGADDGQRKQLSREVHLLHQAGVADDGAGAPADDVGEQSPGEQSGEQVDAEAVDRLAAAQEYPDGQRIDEQLQERADERPQKTQDRVLVLDLKLLADQLTEQLPVLDHLPHRRPEPTPERPWGIDPLQRLNVSIESRMPVWATGNRAHAAPKSMPTQVGPQLSLGLAVVVRQPPIVRLRCLRPPATSHRRGVGNGRRGVRGAETVRARRGRTAPGQPGGRPAGGRTSSACQ